MAPNFTSDEAPDVDEREADPAAALEAENVALRERMMRALADADNTRRRAERSAQDARQFAVTDFARELLTVADNLERAIAAAEHRDHDPTSGGDASLTEGVRATRRMLTSILERFGVRRIEALAAPFDPALHEAMMEVEDASHEPGTVVRVMEDGYTIHGRLLRPARVVVAKRPANASPNAPEPHPQEHHSTHSRA